MKAVVFRRYGGPDVLELEDVDKPRCRENELLIKVCAVEATKSDCELRSFRFPVGWFWLPLRLFFGVFRPRKQILGAYFSGTVVAKGASASRFEIGDQIFGTTGIRFGAYGEYVALPEQYCLSKVPENCSLESASAVPLGGLNALHFMNLAKIKEGDRVLVNGAGGSIGTFAMQIARARKAHVTAVDAGHKQKKLAPYCDAFVDYEKQHYSELNQTFDVILDMPARKNLRRIVRSLTKEGRYLTANPRLRDMLGAAIFNRISSKKMYTALAQETQEELDELARMLGEGTIHAVLDGTYPLAEVRRAHERVEQEQRQGCVVLLHPN